MVKRKQDIAAIVAVEIAPEIVEVWLSTPFREADETDEDLLARTAQSVVARYSDFPRCRTERDGRAEAILRQQMIDKAIQFSKPGDSSWSVTSAANDLLDNILGRE